MRGQNSSVTQYLSWMFVPNRSLTAMADPVPGLTAGVVREGLAISNKQNRKSRRVAIVYRAGTRPWTER